MRFDVYSGIVQFTGPELKLCGTRRILCKISSVAVIAGAVLNVILDPIFMFSWGLNMGVEGASLATTISQCVTFCNSAVVLFRRTLYY